MQNFCIKENIKYINGIPYYPHSQGTIERFHYTIKKYLAKEFISNDYQKFNFSEVRIKVMNFYNNKNHRLIGMTPNQAAKLTNENDINKVNKIKENEFNKINLKRTYLETDNKIQKTKNTFKKGAEYIADSKLLKKIKDKTWKSIVSELNNKN